MDDRPICVLLIEDNLADAGLVRHMLSGADRVRFDLEHFECVG